MARLQLTFDLKDDLVQDFLREYNRLTDKYKEKEKCLIN